MAGQDEVNEDRWVGHPVLAAALKAVLYVVPLIASSLAVVVLAQVVPVFGSRWLWLGTLGAVAVGVSVAVERLVRRLLPLATLLKLTMLFPDKAPSRYKMARSAGNPEALAERLSRKNDATALGAAEQVLALITALGNHDRRTRGHSERVRVFADLLAEQLRLDEPARDRLRWASLLHDLGKLSVAATVLNKPAKLDNDEFALMKLHPERGAELAGPLLPWLGEWGRGIIEHHEKYDGTGYPAGLSGTDISTAGRVIGLVDAFETMTAARPYKKPMPTRAARQELTDCAGKHFDPLMVRAFLSVSLPQLVWAMGPLSFLVQLPFLSALAQTGTRASQLGGQAAATTATTVASAGVVATASVVPFIAPAAYEPPAPPRAQAASAASTSTDDHRTTDAAAEPDAPLSPTDLFGATGPTGLEGFGSTSEQLDAVTEEQDASPDAALDDYLDDLEEEARPVTRPVRVPEPLASTPPAAEPEPEPEPVPAPDPVPVPDPVAGEPPVSEPVPEEPVPVPTEPAPSASPSPVPSASPSPKPSASPKPSPSPSPTRTPTTAPTTPPAEAPAPLPAPTVVLDSAPTGTRTAAGAAVAFHSPDPLADAFQCRLDGGTWIGCATSATSAAPATWTVFPANGDHEIDVRAASPLGGWGPVASTGTFRMAVPPTVALANPGTLTTSALSIPFSSADATVTSFECSLDGAAWQVCTSPFTRTVANGLHELRVRATSSVAGTGPAATTGPFEVKVPPVVTYTQVPVGDHPSSTLELRFVSDQPGSTFTCRIDNDTPVPCSSPLLLTGLVDGPHHVKVSATSAVTGTGSTTNLNYKVVDTGAPGPDTVFGAFPAGPLTSSSATVSFSSPEATAGFRCKVDGGALQVCTSPLRLTGLADGPHTVDVYAVSSTGLVGPTRRLSFSVAVPQLTLTDVPSATTTATAVTFSWTGGDGALVEGHECRIAYGGGGGVDWAPCSSGAQQYSSLPLGTHRFEVRARAEDAEGVNHAEHTWQVTAPGEGD